LILGLQKAKNRITPTSGIPAFFERFALNAMSYEPFNPLAFAP